MDELIRDVPLNDEEKKIKYSKALLAGKNVSFMTTQGLPSISLVYGKTIENIRPIKRCHG